MSIPKYDRDKYYRIMDRTQSNYANQLKRLSKDGKRADFILIYYSLALIIYALSVEFYPNLFDENWTSYSSIILSVIVLIYSIINSKAEYPARIAAIQEALNEVKRLKRQVGELPDSLQAASSPNEESCEPERGCTTECNQHLCVKLESIKEEYDELVSSTEIRDDLDFYYTILHLCKQYELDPYTGKYKGNASSENQVIIEEIQGYISENNPRIQKWHVRFLTVCHFVLYIAPIIIFALGIFFRNHSLLFFL